MNAANKAKDLTGYARSLGYQGKKPVLVRDGIVVSHRNQDWGLFCDRLREQFFPSREDDLNAIAV